MQCRIQNADGDGDGDVQTRPIASAVSHLDSSKPRMAMAERHLISHAASGRRFVEPATSLRTSQSDGSFAVRRAAGSGKARYWLHGCCPDWGL